MAVSRGVASPAEIPGWRFEFGVMTVLVVRSDLSAAVLETPDEFILVGGDLGTVERALGQPVQQARAEFTEYAKAMASFSRHLPGVAARYNGD